MPMMQYNTIKINFIGMTCQFVTDNQEKETKNNIFVLPAEVSSVQL